MKSRSTTRIYNRFLYYSVADCRCDLCLYWQGRRCGCLLDICCCQKERDEALRRETTTALHDREQSCRA
ncbi:MAG: hypothetical protein LBL86_04280 [Coriobacteriales bacterium]|nr:hypothetical protein [Coriobacteriales bacterium]